MKLKGQIGKLGTEHYVSAGEGKYYKLHQEDVTKIQKLTSQEEIMGEKIEFEVDATAQKPINFEAWVKAGSCELQ